MKNKLFILTGSLLLIIATACTASAHTLPADTAKNLYALPGNPYPAIPAEVSRLFYLQRTPNANTIVYELNVNEDGTLKEDEPVHPYWLHFNEKEKKGDLNFIQRKFAYGVTSKPLGGGKYDIRFVSYKKFPLTLMKAADGKYHIFATISQRQFIINRIFVRVEGGSFWVPNVRFVEFKGTDPATGKEVTERFKP